MKFTLDDGTYAHLCGIIQTANYRQDYKEFPPDATQEVKRIAQTFMAPAVGGELRSFCLPLMTKLSRI